MLGHVNSLGKILIALAALSLCSSLAIAADDTWINDAAKAKGKNPPFTRRLFAGEVLKINLVKSKALRLTLAEYDKGGLLAIIPMKDGRRTGSKILMKDEPVIFTETLAEASYLAVKIITGRVKLTSELADMRLVEIAEGSPVELPIRPRAEISGRFVNISEFRSTCIFSFYKNGEEVSSEPKRNRTLTLEFKGSNKVKTWKPNADTLKIETVRGNILFKYGTPFVLAN